MPANIDPSAAIREGPSLIIRLYDAVKAVKGHKTRLNNLARQCDDLLYTVREHSPRLVGSLASAEADEIERAIERILNRVLVWVSYGDTAAFVKQNEIQLGIDECYRELSACSDRFGIALSLVDKSENRVREEARQRDHRQVYDLLADLYEEVRRSGRSVVSEPLALLSAPQTQVNYDSQQVVIAEAQGSANPVVISPRQRSTDLSGRVSVVRGHAVLEGRFFDFILGEWTNDGAPATLGRPRDQSPPSQMRFKDKVEFWHGLHHRNVLSFFGHVRIEDIVYSVSPWMENGNIRDYVRGNPDADRMRLLSEVASGMEFLHENGIVHGDLCGKNVLIGGDGKAFLCGFNLSEFVNLTSDASRARWLAPERITSASVTSPTFKADVWSFGLLCLEVFTDAEPYSSYSDLYVPVLLSQGKPPENPGPAAVGLSSKMWELMQSCWEVDPAVRPDMDKIQLAMRDILPRVELRPNVTPRRPSTSSAQNQLLPPTPPSTNGSSSHERSRSPSESSSIAPLTPPPVRPNVIAHRPSTPPARNQLLLPTVVPPTTNGSSSHERSRGSSESSSIPAPLTPPPVRPNVMGHRPNTSPARNQLLLPTIVPPTTDGSSSHERGRGSSESSSLPAPLTPPPIRPNAIARHPSTSPARNQLLPPTLVPLTANGISHERSRSSSESSSIPPPTPPPTNTGLQLTLEPSTITPPLSGLSEIEETTVTLKRGGNASSLTSTRLPTLREDDHDTYGSGMPSSLSAPSQTSLFSHLPSPSSRSSSVSSPSPRLPLAPNLQRHTSMDSTSSRSSTSTTESGPRPARKLSRFLPFPTRRSRSTTSGTSVPVPVTQKPPKSSPRSWSTPAETSNVAPQPSPSATSLPILAPTRRWIPVSRAVLDSLERAASDPESLLRPAKDGSVSAGNLEGLFTRAIAGSADPSRDERFKAALLTIYHLFATSDRLFEILKRRFELTSTSLDPSMARSRYHILLFIESWLKKGFEDPELTCSSKIREFARSVSGSQTMEEKAREIVRLVDDPDHVRLRNPESCPHLRNKPAPRPREVTPSDVANALTVIEGNRFEKITYWDFVNFIRQPNVRRIEAFNTAHDLIKNWVQRTVLEFDYVDERIKKYEFWVSTAQVCRKLKNFSSTSAIVTALLSPTITNLALTCESRPAKQILQGLAKELSLTDGSCRNNAGTKELIPWLDPHLTSLNSTFIQSYPIVEVDGHPLIDFKQFSELAEQVDSIVQYTPPRIEHATRQDLLAYIEYSLESSTSGDASHPSTEALSAKLALDESKMVEARARMRSLGFPWSPPRRK